MKKHKLIILFFIFALGAFFRFYLINRIPFGLYPDEAMNGNNALEALATNDFNVFYPENNGREGLFMNIQALSIAVFGREPWALRIVSGLFGTFTILGIFLVTRELFFRHKIKKTRASRVSIALLSSFFLATSYWHINFSRIGFRAIMVPFFTVFSLFFLLKGLRTKRTLTLVYAGIFTGLGFYSYIAYRFFIFVLAIPLLAELFLYVRQRKYKTKTEEKSDMGAISCRPCAVFLFLFITFVTALPIGLYFLRNPQDFIGRGSQISVFSTATPMKEFIASTIKTAGMFFVRGDCNWRHNFNCAPEVAWPVALFLVFGFIAIGRDFIKRKECVVPLTLVGWFIFLSFPATLTWEGIPHALRSIGMIPPVMIIAAYGAWRFIKIPLNWFEKNKTKFPDKIPQLNRIQKEVKILFSILLLFMPVAAFHTYFSVWSDRPETYNAFASDLYHLALYLDKKPADATGYIVANLPGTDVRGIPMPAQSVMFITDTFRPEQQAARHIFYVTPDHIDAIQYKKGEKIMITLLNGLDAKLVSAAGKRFPDLHATAPSDFITLQNY